MDSIASSGTTAVVIRNVAATPTAWLRASSRNARKISREITRSKTRGLSTKTWETRIAKAEGTTITATNRNPA
jgi:hypothetical protein